MFQVIGFKIGNILLQSSHVAVQTYDMFSGRFGCHVLLAISCSDGDNNAVSVRVNPVCGLFCIAATATLGIGVGGNRGACGF